MTTLPDPQQLFDALAEYYPPTGAEYVAALRKAGMDDEEIVNDYTACVRDQPDAASFVAAMKRRIEEARNDN